MQLINPIPIIGKKLIAYIIHSKPFVQKRICHKSEELYKIVTTQIDYNSFFNELKLSNTFYSWYTVTGLHLWMLFVRLKNASPISPLPGTQTPFKEPNVIMDNGKSISDLSDNNCKLMKKVLTMSLYHDLTDKLKRMKFVGKDKKYALRDIWGHFQFCHFDYDSGLVGSDKDLAASLFRTFFSQSSDDLSQPLVGQESRIEASTSLNPSFRDLNLQDPTKRMVILIDYVRRSIQYLDSLQRRDLLEGNIILPTLKPK